MAPSGRGCSRRGAEGCLDEGGGGAAEDRVRARPIRPRRCGGGQSWRRRFRPDDFASGSDSSSPSSQLLGLTPTMLSTSLRRAAWAPLSGISRSNQNIPSSVLGATRHLHQRQYSSSSSKPPVPPSDGSRRMDTSTPAKGVNSSGEKGKSARRRGKENGARNGSSKAGQQDAAFSKLPSVPSTQHRQPHG